MGNTIVGTCSICGGAVTVPLAWWGIFPPTPTCSSCGAVEASPHGPVVEMRPRAPTFTGTGTGTIPTITQMSDGTWRFGGGTS